MTPWTLEELTRRVNGALQHEAVFQANGQVAEAPNPRAIRWYQSIGLVRRPVQRGRVAYYGPAHLYELVAIKRFQALGLSLAEIQTRLLGASDERVAAIACVPREYVSPTVTVPAFAVTDTVNEGEREDWWAGDVEAPAVEAPPTARTAVELDGAMLVLPAGCTAPTELVGRLLADLLHQISVTGHLPAKPLGAPGAPGAPTRAPTPSGANSAETRVEASPTRSQRDGDLDLNGSSAPITSSE